MTNLDDPEVQKQVQSKLNRLSEGNIEAILNQIVELYSQHPFQVVTHHIAKVATKLLLEQPNGLQSIIQTMSVLLVSLYQIHDVPFFSQVMRMFIECFRKSIEDNTKNGVSAYEGHCLG